MERWLTQRMSTRLGAAEGRRDGICANVAFPFPRKLVAEALSTATGLDPETDPWLPERSVWPLLHTVDESLGEPWLSSLATHLGDAEAEVRNRRFASVRHIADLYDRYAIRRPQMLAAWARGEDTDGTGRPLPGDGRWQAELWRRLRERIDTPSPAERLAPACERLRREPGVIELPARLSLFGLTRLPASYLEVLAALASRPRRPPVRAPSLAGAVGTDRQRKREGTPAIVRRAADPTATAASNRLLASWGQDSRELQLVLDGAGPDGDLHHETEPTASGTLLTRIQDDIRADRAPPGPPLPGQEDRRPPLDPADRSLQIHGCHGRARQVEVVRDAILHLLEDDPTLEPRDVIVMCPDIETIAPLIQAAFGAGRVESENEEETGIDPGKRLPDLRVRLADRSLRQTNPVLGAVSALLELADQRVTASQLLDLADREPVRRRFRFDDEDITRLQEWVVSSGIRWGLDAPHREPFKLGELPAGTWQAGLDRILLGVAMTEEHRELVGGALPLDDVDTAAIDLAGRMAEFVDRVIAAVDALRGPQVVPSWAARIAAAADALTATSERDAWQRGELRRILDDVLASATRDGLASDAMLELADVRALLADRLRGRPTRANFRTGHLTICTLVPMRSVPHRVVCVLGLDDGEFPRKASRDGDDLMLADPHVGDRDPRSEDRQMLLDALLAATERLIITYTGNDERTNIPRPPAVPVAELLDVVERTVRGGERPAREQVLVRHPLQPFDPRNFRPGGLVADRAWSFDRVALDGARAMSGPRRAPGPFLTSPLPAPDSGLIELESLVRFVQRPVRAFLRDRLGISVGSYRDDVQDALPVELDHLEQWGVAQRLLEGLISGAPLVRCVEAETARGTLPPGQLAGPLLDRILPTIELLAAEAVAHGTGESGSLDVNFTLPDGRTLAGTVPGVCEDTISRVSYSRLKPRERLAAWVRLLALSAARPERPFRSVVIGRTPASIRFAQITVATIEPLGTGPGSRRATALRHLATVIELYDRGAREPLPLASDASAAYAQAAGTGEDGEAAAQGVWDTTFRFDREDREPEHLIVHGGQVSFASLLSEPPRADEQGPGWLQTEATRFGRYARRLWDPLLANEGLRNR